MPTTRGKTGLKIGRRLQFTRHHSSGLRPSIQQLARARFVVTDSPGEFVLCSGFILP